jgi:diaminohydroxyphosphoribosylaminopyrimidine deaminase/5-amino-6-(5-phosphoribosylamino)uracil reductase
VTDSAANAILDNNACVSRRDVDHRFMRMAARLAVRGHGGAEPNPPVGCVIVDRDGAVLGSGHHRRFGGPHAEVVALREAGPSARGATVYLTLEPCSHVGKTPPCTEALIDAGVRRVVIARRDPNPIAAGGVDRLTSGGVEVDLLPDCEPAIAVTDPFVYRVRSGLPWLTAKWAQTIDGRIATRTGESKWISSEMSRRMVHRERGRVDAILTGIGTALADDPLLTARDVRVRRTARRIVVDPDLRLPLDAKLVMTARETPTIVACRESAMTERADHTDALRDAGVTIHTIVSDAPELPLPALLRVLVDEYDATNVLVEAGPGLLGSLFRQKLVREAWVFIGPLLLGDDEAMTCASVGEAPHLIDGTSMSLISHRRRGDDVVLRYRVTDRTASRGG